MFSKMMWVVLHYDHWMDHHAKWPGFFIALYDNQRSAELEAHRLNEEAKAKKPNTNEIFVVEMESPRK